MVKFPAKLSFF